MIWIRTLCCIAFAALYGCGGANTSPEPLTVGSAQPKPKAEIYDSASAVGKQAVWVLGILNKGGQVDEATIKAHFSDETLREISALKLQSVFLSLGSSFGPFEVTKVIKQESNHVELLLESKSSANNDEKLLMIATVGLQASTKLTMLQFRPAPTPIGPLATSWQELDTMMSTAALSTTLSVSKIDSTSGVCSSVYNPKPSETMPLGSSFKLYVLAVAADFVEKGTLKWTTQYPIKSGLKSLPSGSMQHEPVGKMFSLQTYANLMMSESDNTATDHIFNLVGRKQIEAQLDSMGNTQKHNKPFLMTHEMFKVKTSPQAIVDAYAQSNEAQRREMLLTIAPKALPTHKRVMQAFKAPQHIRTIEWFASAKDMCALHARFVQNASKPSYKGALKAMSISDGGLRLDKQAWPFVGYKGGSEPGVLYLSYLVRRKDGQWFSINLGWADEKKTINHRNISRIIQSVSGLLK